MTRFVGIDSFYQKVSAEPGTGQAPVAQFNIFRIEDLLLPKSKQVSYSKRNFFKISIITGHNKIHYADQCIEVHESALIFTNPMIPYSWEILGERQTGYLCVFTEDFFSRFGNIRDYPVFQSADQAIIPLDDAGAAPFITLFIRMLSELNGDYVFKYDLIRNLLYEIVHTAQKMRPASGTALTGSNAAERISSLFLELLERQFPIELSNQVVAIRTPADFARQLNVHVNHLNKALKETTGQTTSQLISTRILQESKILLKSTNWTINEIAWSLGFEEPNHFSGFFKSRTKVSPSSFRAATID
ncbi:helix-turn-helix domain-containing protein [Pedobacter duraquae]|uniref:Helix-turn-helix protein n=1 Tax=Pedobacter duraquae TaxID=425511 RepID=A0A4R6ILU8_9SPHI|nr:helix-turn-helix domain-containing protein [Pedobacter duraquae]TDO22915.1 helix-turn-helix protein [Pedobacter duraquae]